MPADPASYRDPSGHVYDVDDRIFRTVLPAGLAGYEHVRDSGALAPLINKGWIIESTEVASDVLGKDAPGAGLVLEHPRIPFVSYPYEWTFAALKSAALLHLDIQIELLAQGIVLSDASAYNIQFIGTRPVFIDTLSFRPYRENEHWLAHRQFCDHFLNPLLLYSQLGIPFNAWLNGSLEGIPAHQLAPALNFRDKFSLRILSHVTLPARLQSSMNSTTGNAGDAKARGLPNSRYHAILVQLRDWIDTLEPKGIDKTVWRTYAAENTYDATETEAKHRFIARFVDRHKPRTTLDLGCNSGDFSKTALEAGASYAIGIDADHGALEYGFAKRSGGDDMLLLYQDATNPSPNLGWHGRERKSLTDRCRSVDAVLALAFEHHLAIARNVPFDMIVDWLIDLAPSGVIEFVPKNDPTVQKLLALRDDIFEHYDEAHFVKAIERRARITESETISATNRKLFSYVAK